MTRLICCDSGDVLATVASVSWGAAAYLHLALIIGHALFPLQLILVLTDCHCFELLHVDLHG